MKKHRKSYHKFKRNRPPRSEKRIRLDIYTGSKPYKPKWTNRGTSSN